MNDVAEHDPDACMARPSPTRLFALCLEEVEATWRKACQAGRPVSAPNLRRLFERAWWRRLQQVGPDQRQRLYHAGLRSIRTLTIKHFNARPSLKCKTEEPAGESPQGQGRHRQPGHGPRARRGNHVQDKPKG